MAGNFKLSLDELGQRLLAVEEDLGSLRELVARAYEGTPRNAAEAFRARREPSYRTAYEPEPLVSVRIGAYRGGDLLFERALRSVREQTYPNLEVVVVCDGRDEETARRIEGLGDPRLRTVQRPRNGPYPEDRGARWRVAGTHPFNQAVALARGSWIAPIDQDDEWSQDHLEVLLEWARTSGAEVVYGVAEVLLDDGSETYFGAWPPAEGDFGWQAGIYNAALSPFFLYDVNSHLLGEPADWNLARRMLEAGVAFEFVEKVVTSYFVERDDAVFNWWKKRERERGAFQAGGRS